MNKIHFIGIKGSGMSALALICSDLGMAVTGSDVPQYLFTQKKLEERGIPLLPFSADNIKGDRDVIIGASFDESHPEVKAVLNNQSINYWYYYDYLAKLISEHTSISVAGSHGKTTTTGMLQTLLNAQSQTGYLIGDGNGQLFKESEYFVVESCEYKDHFHFYHPDYAIITSIDLDHVDYFKSEKQYFDSFQTFVNQVKKGLVLFGDDHQIRQLNTASKETIYYGSDQDNDLYVENVEVESSKTHFDLIYKNEKWGRYDVDIIGQHNIHNLLSTIGIAILLGFDKETIVAHINDFKGVNRRFIIEEFPEHVYIDDYAHHPTEISVTIDAAKQRFPDRKIVVVYKPDRISRIQYFEQQFKDALLKADKAYVLDFPESAYHENPDYSIEQFVGKQADQIPILENNEKGAHQLSLEGNAVYLFVSPKDIYKFKDLLKETFKDV